MNKETYRDKVLACWNGKNAGGTLGGPLECKRGEFDLTGYLQKMDGEPLPNDDLDLQLVWLSAVEKYGPQVNSDILSEYWLTHITPYISEYGGGKINLRHGLKPPLSGVLNNPHKDSNGAWILTEIWACLAPGYPQVATRYAYEDARVNHADEGIYAAVFVAAMESAAFVESDLQKLIDIGLSYIPADCAIARITAVVREAYASGKTWKEARKLVLQAEPNSFGALGTPREKLLPDEPVGKMGYDAPGNIGFLLVGLLYGQGDFSESICIAAGCGEDADCTAGTLGSLLGIIYGSAGIPARWLEPLGGKIKTICVNLVDKGVRVPATTEELTDRVVAQMPRFIQAYEKDAIRYPQGYEIQMSAPDRLAYVPKEVNYWTTWDFRDKIADAYVVECKTPIFEATVRLPEGVYIEPGKALPIEVRLENIVMQQQWIQLNWELPAEFGEQAISPCTDDSFALGSYHASVGHAERTYWITPEAASHGEYTLRLSIVSEGHPSRGTVYVPLFRR